MSLELSKSNLSQLLISHDFNDFFVSGDASEVFLRKKREAGSVIAGSFVSGRWRGDLMSNKKNFECSGNPVNQTRYEVAVHCRHGAIR